MSDINKLLATLPVAEQIEYRLGKDRYKNLFFSANLPEARDIASSQEHFTGSYKWSDCKNTTITHDNIEYQFNNLGYRSHYDYHADELKTKQNILCLGDSDVFGPYKHYNELWTSILQTRMPEYNIINMGMPFWAADTIVRHAVSTIKELKNSIASVCVIWPLEHRREIVSKTFKRIVVNSSPTDIPYEDYWDHIDWVSNNYNYFKNKELLEAICGAYNIECIDLLAIEIGKNKVVTTEKFGRGPDATTHQAWANWFYKKLMHQPSLYESMKK